MTGVLSKWVRGALVAGLFAGVLGVGDAARAAPPERPAAGARGEQPGPNRARIEVKVVRATATGEMDPRLQDIAKELRSNFPQFQGFQLQSSHGDVLGANQDTSFTFDGGRKATITLLSRDDARARVRIELFNRVGERQVDTTVWIPKGKMFPVGVKAEDGRLLLPVSVSF
jgi:hypothetical protein